MSRAHVVPHGDWFCHMGRISVCNEHGLWVFLRTKSEFRLKSEFSHPSIEGQSPRGTLSWKLRCSLKTGFGFIECFTTTFLHNHHSLLAKLGR